MLGSDLTRLIRERLYLSEWLFLSLLVGGALLTLLALLESHLRVLSEVSYLLPPLLATSLILSVVRYIRIRSEKEDTTQRRLRRPLPLEALASAVAVAIGVSVPLREVLRLPLLVGWDPWAVVVTVGAILDQGFSPGSFFDSGLGEAFYYFVASFSTLTLLDPFTIVKYSGPAMLGILALGLYSAARRLFSWKAGIIASVLLIGSPWVIVRFTLGIRENFAILYLVGVLVISSIFLAKLKRESRPDWRMIPSFLLPLSLLYAIALSGHFATHLIAVAFVAVSVMLTWVVRNQVRGSLYLGALNLNAMLLGFVLVLPLSALVWESLINSIFLIQAGTSLTGYRPFTLDSIGTDFFILVSVMAPFGVAAAIIRFRLRSAVTPLVIFGLILLIILIVLIPLAERTPSFRLILYLIIAAVPFAAFGWHSLLNGFSPNVLVYSALVALLVSASFASGFQVTRWSAFGDDDFEVALFVKELQVLDDGPVVCPVIGDCLFLTFRGVDKVTSVEMHHRLFETEDWTSLENSLKILFPSESRVYALLFLRHRPDADQGLANSLLEMKAAHTVRNASIWIIFLNQAPV